MQQVHTKQANTRAAHAKSKGDFFVKSKAASAPLRAGITGIMENPIKMDDFRGTPISGNPHMLHDCSMVLEYLPPFTP